MFFLAALTVVFGLASSVIMQLLTGVSGSVLGIDSSGMVFTLNNFAISPQPDKGVYLSVPSLALWLVIFGLVGFVLYRMFGRRRRRVCQTWDCGYYKLDSRNEYTATAFSKPLRIAFGFFLFPYRKTQKIRESFYHVKSFTYETHTTQVFKKYIYEPVLAVIFKAARSMRRMQPGSIHLYLAYIFVTLLLLIVLMGRFS